jgi:hypothetical protein
MTASTTRPRVEAARHAVSFPPVEYGGMGDVLASVSIVDDDHPQERDPAADGAEPSAS